jgi:Lactoylglutathione lyase and related lyases
MYFEHVGLSCKDIETQVAFYRDLLKLTVRQHEKTADGATVYILDAQGGGGMELIHRPEMVNLPARLLPDDEVGVRHFCFAVENMKELHAFLTGKGIEFTVEPRPPKVMKEATSVAFCKDPEGNLVEFIEKKPHVGK